jgi:hypothetical protein
MHTLASIVLRMPVGQAEVKNKNTELVNRCFPSFRYMQV